MKLDMKRFRISRGKTVFALVVVAALVAGGLVYQNSSASGSADTDVTAMFADASPLIPGNLIRMGGIEVGEIQAVTLRNGQAAVTMRLQPSVFPLHQDASAKIRPVTLLGERYIDLDRGTATAPVMTSMEIPVQRTSRAVDLDEVLDSLDDPTSTALAALVTSLGEGVSGQGPNIDQAIKALAPAMQNTQQLAQILDQQNSVLSQLVDQAAPVASAVAGKDGKNLDQAVDAGQKMLSAIAAQRQAMQDALHQLPDTLDKAQHVLSQVAGVAEAGTPTLAAARPVTDNLTQITSELNTFADSANPALSSLPPVLDKAKALLDQAAPLARDLRPGAAALPAISSSANRLVGQLSPALTTALDFMKYWAMSTNGRDAISNYFRAFVVVTPQSLLQIPGVGLPGAPPAAAVPNPVAPPAAGVPAAPPAVAPAPILPLPSGTGGSATGLDPTQENSLLDQLLGGL
jgi:phospholipid/cholesterol/gamma-HCH transport system substrate-binding protein